MPANVIAGYLAPEDLQVVFDNLARPGVLLILESFTDLQIEKIGTSRTENTSQIDPASYEEGRLFDESFELRWQRLRGYPKHIPSFRAALICEDEESLSSVDAGRWQSSAGHAARALKLEDTGSESFYLWGEAVTSSDGGMTGEWYEKEVPRLFRYPVNEQAGGRVKLVTRVYRFADEDPLDIIDAGGVRFLQRFSAIVAATEQFHD